MEACMFESNHDSHLTLNKPCRVRPELPVLTASSQHIEHACGTWLGATASCTMMASLHARRALSPQPHIRPQVCYGLGDVREIQWVSLKIRMNEKAFTFNGIHVIHQHAIYHNHKKEMSAIFSTSTEAQSRALSTAQVYFPALGTQAHRQRWNQVSQLSS